MRHIKKDWNEGVRLMKLKLAQMCTENYHPRITCDSWSNVHSDSFMTIAVHIIDEQWNIFSCILGTRHATERHTAKNITKELSDLLNEFRLLIIFNCSQDTAANTNEGVRIWICKNILYDSGCVAHILHLGVGDTFKQCSECDEHVDQLRKLHMHIRRSTILSGELKKIMCFLIEKGKMNTVCKKKWLQIDVTTRWNSKSTMIKSYFDLKPALKILVDLHFAPDAKRLLPDATQEEVLKSLMDYLSILADVTNSWQHEKKVIIGEVYERGEFIKAKIGYMLHLLHTVHIHIIGLRIQTDNLYT